MKNLIISILCATILLTSDANAETKIIPIQDLLFLVPNFDNPPKFLLNNAVNGSGNIISQNNQKRITKTQEKELLGILEEYFPDAKLSIWKGNLIVNYN